MRRYINRHRALLTLTLACSTIFALASALVALILTEVTDVAVSGDTGRFSTLLWQVPLFFLVFTVIQYGRNLFSKRLICHLTRRLRLDVFSGVLRRGVGDFRRVNSADYLSALTNDIKLVEENYFQPLLQVVGSGILLAASVAIMLYLSPLATGFLALMLGLLIVVPALMGSALKGRQDRYSQALASLTVKISDLLSGLRRHPLLRHGGPLHPGLRGGKRADHGGKALCGRPAGPQ